MILTSSDFTQNVLESQGITFVEFFASWCPHCQAFMPEWDQISEQLSNEANFYQVEIDQSPGLADEYNVNAIPTIVVFYNGQEETRLVGAQSEATFQEIINTINNNL